jgi:predicted small lipoprotein YifL
MRLLALFFSLFLLVGCGKKGSLYMPGDPGQPVTTQPAQK